MFFPEGRIRVFVYGQSTDMRKSYDGLYALARNGLRQDVLSGHLFVFINRRGSQTKILYFDRSGWCIWAKRLEAGKFISDWRDVHSREIDWTALKLMLEGIEVERRMKRYRLERNEVESSDAGQAASVASTNADRAIPTSARRR